jgi:hypothetical protein
MLLLSAEDCFGITERSIEEIFERNRAELTGRWKQLHTQELCILYSSPKIVLAK